ncbi:Txe/YoeB family addiction module toxin [Carboxylicivirga sp. N1Y90]|uniref:Txe/YoeB family addiction module toxin n=1 Tax=Carboxylicivirga fragile TaxID=3417571 RepID=UPI003D3283C6|nr:Txe/YoeB family addiction module toxin [Marinilabiliaceae bacterium N1Y90]
MEINFMSQAWEDYLHWQNTDKKTLQQINKLIRQCQRTPYEGIGKPESLKGNLSGWWSRRINHKDRIIYRVEEDTLYILQCRYHY